MTRWRVLLVGALSGLLVLAHLYAPRPEIREAEAQGVGILARQSCSELTSPFQGKTFCFEGVSNVLKYWNGATWTQANATQTGINNVRDYGATGNGTSDDAPAIQLALNAATRTTANGGIVYLPPGTYLLGTRLMVYSNTEILGAGWASVLRLSPSISTSNGQALVTQGASIVRTVNLKLADFAIDGNKANISLLGTPSEYAQSCVVLDFVSSVTISNLYVHECVENALYIANSPDNVEVSGGTYARNGLSGASGGRGIDFNVSPTNIRIHAAAAIENLAQGILVQSEGGNHAASFTISNNVVRGNGQDGIDLTDNATSGSAVQNIMIRQWALTGNVVQGNGRFGIRVSENGTANGGGFVSIAQDGSITGNTVQGNGNDGVRLSTLSDGRLARIAVSANTITGNSGWGVNISPATGSNVTDLSVGGNTIVGNASGSINGSGTRTVVGPNAMDAAPAGTTMSTTVNAAFDARYHALLGGSFAGTTSGTVGLEVQSTQVPPANGSAYGVEIQPSLTRPGSGTTPEYASLNVLAPSVGGSATTISTMTTLNLATAPANGGTNHYFRVGPDLFRIMADGGVLIASATKGNQGVGTLNIASATFLNGFPEAVASATGVNLLSIRGLSASQSLSNNLRGTCTFSAAVTCTVAFAANEPDANYFVVTGGVVQVGSKARSGFLLTATGTNSNAVDWFLIR